MKRAQLPELWTLESFLLKNQPGILRRQVCELGELDFIPQAVNIVFTGPTEVYKTGLPTIYSSQRVNKVDRDHNSSEHTRTFCRAQRHPGN